MVLGELSSGRPSCFPDGLRVLLVDHDSQSLKNLEKLLIKCNYQVTTCNLMQEALRLLRESKGGFDIVISENNMPDMDGFKFLEHVGLEMDIPIILMSANGEMSRVIRGVERGACDYLLKPIRLKELRNIWQHVLRKRMQVNEGDEIRMVRNETEETDMILGKKRKEDQNKNYDSECGHRSSVKKPRVVWTPDLHLKFVKAVNQIGLDKAGPKKILELMEVSWLKRENVASHLQKYRIHLSRIQKEEKLKITSGGVKHTYISSKDTTASDIYSRRLINQNIVTTGNYVDHGFHIHDANVWDGNPNETLSMPMALEAKNAMSGDVIDPSISTPSGMSFNQSFGEVNSRFIIQNQYTWSAKVPPLQIEQQVKPQFQPAHQFDRLSCGNNISYNYGKVTNIKNAAGFYSGRQQSHLTFDPLASCSTWSSTKNHSLDQNLPENLDFDGEFFCAQNQEPVNFELFGGISAANVYDPMIFGGENSSDPMENLVIDQGHLFNDLH